MEAPSFFLANRRSMSVFLIKSGKWRFNFNLNSQRYSKSGFKTKKEAARAEAKLREELENPQPVVAMPTDMGFLDLNNFRLDHVKAYCSERHYQEYIYMVRRWLRKLGDLPCSEIETIDIEKFIFERSKVSNYVANKELRYLRATFNFGINKGLISNNPTKGIAFLPVVKKIKYTPPMEDIDKVIAIASKDIQDYLWAIRETFARVSEINRLTWDDISLEDRYVTLYTRKKSGGHLTPRRIWMTDKLYNILSERDASKTDNHPWVFWHRYYSRKEKCWKEGPYGDRKKIMKTLCNKAGVKYFRFHALRHAGASLMDSINTPIGTIQKILGHENRKTTEIYLHSFSETEKQAIRDYEVAREK